MTHYVMYLPRSCYVCLRITKVVTRGVVKKKIQALSTRKSLLNNIFILYYKYCILKNNEKFAQLLALNSTHCIN